MKKDNQNIESLLTDEQIDKDLEQIEADESLKDVVVDPGTKTALMMEIARRTEEANKSEDVKEDRYAHLLKEEREALEYGLEALTKPKHKKVSRMSPRQKKFTGITAAVVVLSVGVGGVGITSKFKELMIGKDPLVEGTRITVESEEDIILDTTAGQENEAYQEATEFLGMEVSWLLGGSADLEFQGILLYEDIKKVDVRYRYDNSAIVFEILTNYNKVSYYTQLDEELLDSYTQEVNGTEIKIEQYPSDSEGKYKYVLWYEHNNLFYSITASSVEEDVVKKILKNIKI